MAEENINKHGVDLSKLVAGKSVITFYDEEEEGIFTGTYLMPGADGWLLVRFHHSGDYDVDPDYVRSISNPDSRWE